MDMTTALICERWGIPLGESGGDDQWFTDWAQREPRAVSRHLTAGYLAYRSLARLHQAQPFESAVEYFGGLGAQSLMIQRRFAPREHTVADSSPQAVRHLTRLLGERGVTVRQADSYSDVLPGADLVGLDFGDLTAHRAVKGPHHDLLQRVFAGSPRAVVLTDIAGPRLHLHSNRYYRALVSPTSTREFDTYDEYLYALGVWITDTFGYHLLSVHFHHWSAVLAFSQVQSPSVGHGFREVEDHTHPVGLVLG